MKTVAFIKTYIPKLVDDSLEPDLGLLYLATYLKNRVNNIKVLYIDLSVLAPKEWDDIKQEIDIFCFSTYTANYYETLKVRYDIKKENAIFVAGGHHVSALPEEAAKDFDYVVVGEGETALVELITNILENKESEKIIYGKPILDLDSIDFPDYDLVDLEKYTRKVNGLKSISILTSRGCPYKCEFCNSTLLKKDVRIRFRSAKNVVDEILSLHNKYGITAFRIQDDIFSINKERLNEMANELQRYNFSFRCFSRIDNIDEDILQLYKKIGITHISFGLESGSQKILDAMCKGLKVDQMISNMQLVKKYGFKTRAFFIVGYPGETIETLDETINLIRTCQPDEISIYPLIPYPGTKLYHYPEKYNITYIDPDFSKYYQIFGEKESGFVYETTTLSRKDIQEMRNYVTKGIEDVCIWAIDSEDNI